MAYEHFGWNSALGGYALRDSDTRLVTDVSADDEPLTLADELIHSRIDLGSPVDADEQAYVESLFPAARKIVESIIRRPIRVQEFELMMVSFPCGSIIELTRPNVAEVQSIKYTKDDGTVVVYYDQTASPVVNNSDLVIETGCTPGAIFLKAGESWPIDTLLVGFPLKIRFTAGIDPVPGDLLQYMRLVLGFMYENREVAQEQVLNHLPAVKEWLLNNYGYRVIA